MTGRKHLAEERVSARALLSVLCPPRIGDAAVRGLAQLLTLQLLRHSVHRIDQHAVVETVVVGLVDALVQEEECVFL